MPPVDLETLLAAAFTPSTDRKITCETLAADEDSSEDASVAAHDVPPDFPPESFWLSKDAEIDWYDSNAFFERKESTKGVPNSSNSNPNFNSNPQRFSANRKSRASLFGLPKTQKTNYIDTKRRVNKPANVKLFPKRSASSVGKAAASIVEPSSPKVSCMGRVRSKRGRRRSSEHSHNREKRADKSRSLGDYKRKKKGFYSRVLSMFQSPRKDKKPAGSESENLSTKEEEEEEERRKSAAATITRRMPEIQVSVEPTSEPPGLAGMKKLASGRRSSGDFDAAQANSLRQRVPLEEVD